MKFSWITTVCASAVLLCSASVFSNDYVQSSNNQQTQNQGQEAGTAAKPSLKGNQSAKAQLAPHSLMIESQLLSTRAQIDGLKSQVGIEQGVPDAAFLNHVKMYSKNIDSGIKQAQTHDKELSMALQKNYPQVANSDDGKNLGYAINDLQSFYKSWSDKAMERSYWQDKDQAKADLDSLGKRLDKAIDTTRSFNSGQLDISSIG